MSRSLHGFGFLVVLTFFCGSGFAQIQPIQIDAGRDLTLELDGGQLRAWGYDLQPTVGGAANLGYVRTPALLTGIGGVTAISSGTTHALALNAQGAILAGGSNYWGELGFGIQTPLAGQSTPNSPQPSFPMQVISGLGAGFVGIEAGEFCSFAWDANGTVLGWGSDRFGELGTFPSNGPQSVELLPVIVPVPGAVVAMASKQTSHLALDSMGRTWFWGTAFGSQSVVPIIELQGLPTVNAIAAAGTMGVALGSLGQVFVWSNNAALLPPGIPLPIAAAPSLRRLTGIPPIQSISAGNGNCYCLDVAGNVWAFGAPRSAWAATLAGFGALAPSNIAPRMLPGLSNIVHVASDGDAGGYARDAAGQLWAFGYDGRAGLGLGAAPVPVGGLRFISPRPQLVDNGPGVPSIISTGTGCGATIRRLLSETVAGLDSEVVLNVYTSLPAFLFVAPGTTASAPATPFPGCSLWLDPASLIAALGTGFGPLPALADNPNTLFQDATWVLRVPNDPGLLGLSISSQALLLPSVQATPILTNAITHLIN